MCIKTEYQEFIESVVDEVKQHDNQIVELISEEVHNAWMNEKRKQGFHSPDDCQSKNHESLTDLNNPKFYKWCDKCHTDLYPYSELPENIKEYDRVTVRAVIEAMSKVKSYFGSGR